MTGDTGTFRVDIEIENPAAEGRRERVANVLVDTGAELSWFPAHTLEALGVRRRRRWHFKQADGTTLERWAGSARVFVAGVDAVDEVIFGEPSDLVLLGARSLEGLNLRVDPRSKSLIDAGPATAAVA